MRVALLASTVGLAAAAFPGERDLSNYSFEDYQNEFQIFTNDLVSKDVFEANLKVIQEFNANTEKTFFLTPTRFTHMTNDEFRAMTRGRNKAQLFGGLKLEANLEVGDIPASKDWRDDGVVTAAKNQGSCGSCWAFSATETLESHLALATGEAVQILSPQQITSCAPNPDHCGGTGGCSGSTQPLAFNYTSTAGITTEASYPYKAVTGTCDESKIDPVGFNDGTVELTVNDYTELITAVATKGPVAISIAAGGFTFQFYGGGVLKNCNDFVMDHAVQLVGYGTDGGDDYWLVRNSWGSWGENGYVRIARYGEGKEPCGVDTAPGDGDACEGDTTQPTLCGECGILSSSSYPSGMRSAGSVSI